MARLTFIFLITVILLIVRHLCDLCQLEVILALLAHAVRVSGSRVPLDPDPAVIPELPYHCA